MKTKELDTHLAMLGFSPLRNSETVRYKDIDKNHICVNIDTLVRFSEPGYTLTLQGKDGIFNVDVYEKNEVQKLIKKVHGLILDKK